MKMSFTFFKKLKAGNPKIPTRTRTRTRTRTTTRTTRTTLTTTTKPFLEPLF